ncbi:hypothetical protein JVT61DRAFT_3919 [Boletus reticuloceps]|uniref:Zn(2)-C6 fungal-type domain-containing protein n=1 Tax=Boletus reticuloceps TaxID=495285 RepID=A0A8I3A7H2_9AGAM|nr:hypothetical protein JVT61DRAFT_3919 [Boletus reticuloceps]
MFPTCSPGSQIAGACGSCRTSNYLCSLSQNGGSCIQCKTRRKKCDYAGPRGLPRAKSHIRTRQRSPSPPMHPPPLKKCGAQSYLRRSASPAKACSSIQQRRSPTPIPTKRRRVSSRVTMKNNARSILEESQRLPMLIIPPVRNQATVAPVINSEERPMIPLPTRGHSPRSANRAMEPAELGVTLGKTYNVWGDHLMTREEHQEMQRQFTAMKAENDWIKSELNNVYTLIRDMQANMLCLRGTVKATHLFSMGSGEQHPDQRLSSSLNIAAEISQGSAPHSLPSNVANLSSEERDSIPPIETLAIGIKETETDPFPNANPEEINPVSH